MRRRVTAPTWDGVVTEKKAVKKRRKKYGEAHTQGMKKYEWQSYTVYQVIIQKDDGDVFVLSDEDSSFRFDNYVVGDRVRYHGFIDYVEKYDKRNSRYIICAYCGNDNEPCLDSCLHCDEPLLKGAAKQ